MAAWQAAAEQFAAVSVDAMGTPVARVDGRGEHPLLAVVGHIDEIAVLVSHVTKEGYLKVVSSGGWDPQILVGQRVQVLGAEGPVPGVCGRKPIHLLEAEERKKAVDLKGLHVDIGAADRDEALELVRRRRSRGDRHRAGGAARRPAWPRARSTTGWASTWRSRWRAAWPTRAAGRAPWRRWPPCRRRSGRSAPARWRTGSSRTWRSWST